MEKRLKRSVERKGCFFPTSRLSLNRSRRRRRKMTRSRRRPRETVSIGMQIDYRHLFQKYFCGEKNQNLFRSPPPLFFGGGDEKRFFSPHSEVSDHQRSQMPRTVNLYHHYSPPPPLQSGFVWKGRVGVVGRLTKQLSSSSEGQRERAQRKRNFSALQEGDSSSSNNSPTTTTELSAGVVAVDINY